MGSLFALRLTRLLSFLQWKKDCKAIQLASEVMNPCRCYEWKRYACALGFAQSYQAVIQARMKINLNTNMPYMKQILILHKT